MLVDLTGVPDVAVAVAITFRASHLTEKDVLLRSAWRTLLREDTDENLRRREPQKGECERSSEEGGGLSREGEGGATRRAAMARIEAILRTQLRDANAQMLRIANYSRIADDF